MKYTLNSTDTGNSSTFVTKSQVEILQNQITELQDDIDGITESLSNLQEEITDTGTTAANNLANAVIDITAAINNFHNEFDEFAEAISSGITTESIYANNANINKINSEEIESDKGKFKNITTDNLIADDIKGNLKSDNADIDTVNANNINANSINSKNSITSNYAIFNNLNSENITTSNFNIDKINSLIGNFGTVGSNETLEFVGDYDDQYHFLTLRGVALLYNENSTILITPSGVFSNFDRLKAAHFKNGKSSIYFENGAKFNFIKLGPVTDIVGGAIPKTFIQQNVINGNSLNVASLDLSQFIAKNDIQF